MPPTLPSPARGEWKGERGMALVLTLLVLVLLVTAVLEFDRSTRTMVKAAGNFRDGMKAFHLATSGIAAAQAVLKDDWVNHRGRDDLTELWATPLPPYPLGDGTVAVAIQDEGGKINVNALVKGTAKQSARITQLRELFRIKGLDPAPVDAIVDWLDQDDIEEPAGAESAYYERLDRPYRCRNGRMDTLAELHLVKGITDEVYRVISPYLTVYPRDTDAPRINLNTADPVVIQASLASEKGVPPDAAAQVDRIIAARPFSKLIDMDTVSGLDALVKAALKSPQYYVLTSDVFSVYAEGEANGVKKGVLAIVDRSHGEPVLKYWRLAD